MAVPLPEAQQLRPQLLPQHQELIAKSAISPEVAEARGYRSVATKAELRGLRFSDRQCRVPALLSPVYNVLGEIATHQIRPDDPRVSKDGRRVKYETPSGSRMVLDVPPAARQWLRDPQRPLFITEGVRKADSAVSHDLCCVDLLGVWNWRGSNELGGKTALADWDSVALNGRLVYLCFDSDAMTNPAVYQALLRLKAFLEQRGAHVILISPPPGDGGAKVGLDDYLAAGHSVEELLQLASPDLRPVGREHEPQSEAPYRATSSGLEWLKHTHNGITPVRLTNFTARIVSEVVEDDGAETKRSFQIEGSLKGRTTRFSVGASQFTTMNWPMEHLGAGAVVFAGLGTKDHARAGMQLLSGEVTTRTVYAHTGWRQVDGTWVYLHAGGAIGADGPVAGVEVRLPEDLARYALPEPPAGEELVSAIRASMAILDLAPDVVTVPLFCSIWRAALMTSDISLHLSGETGEGKTALAVLVQQHWGIGFDARRLPGSWLSTGNALEGLAFIAKDAVVVVDDFAPSGSSADVARFHREADRLLRAQGNNSGRRRMGADATLRPPKPPRGLIVSTGEDVPRGQSLRSRIFVLELAKGVLDWQALTTDQRDAAAGLYAQAMAGYVKWLAPRYEEMRAGLNAEVSALREQAFRGSGHRRTPDIVANLAVGLRYFLAFAQDVGALTVDEADALWARGWKALGLAAAAQASHQAAAEPTRRFLELLAAAIASGRAHVAGPDGFEPDTPRAWGWRQVQVGTGDYERTEWRPQGHLVGWVEGDDLFLEPEASYAGAQAVARESGESMPVASRTLHKRLSERGLLVSRDEQRGRLTVRHTLGGSRRAVLHLQAKHLVSREPAQLSQTAHPLQESDEGAEDGTERGKVLAPPRVVPSREPSHEDAAAEGAGASEEAPAAQVGQLGHSPEVDRSERNERQSATGNPALPLEPTGCCYACGGLGFWRYEQGGWQCERCHPPGDPARVADRIHVPVDNTFPDTSPPWLQRTGATPDASAQRTPQAPALTGD